MGIFGSDATNVCVCGGGSLGTAVAGVLSHQGMTVNILTGHPDKWHTDIDVEDAISGQFSGHISNISSEPNVVVPDADIIILCLPGYLIKDTIINIRPFLKKSAAVGTIFSSTGFFFEAMKVLPDSTLWGFQRVPYIARVKEYGKSVKILGHKEHVSIAVENANQTAKEQLRKWVETAFSTPTGLLKNYLEASISNSNPLLHTARLYSMFASADAQTVFPYNPLFYHEWTDEASKLLIEMDNELFRLIDKLPVTKGFLQPILPYYDSFDAASLTAKLRSIAGFAGIYSPMKQTANGWIPDFSSRYFTEDFPYGLNYIYRLACECGVETPRIKEVLEWGLKVATK
jgi:hypothetical protein